MVIDISSDDSKLYPAFAQDALRRILKASLPTPGRLDVAVEVLEKEDMYASQ